MNKRHAGSSALMVLTLGLTLLSGCSDVNQFLGKEDSIDYKSTKRGDPLSIPPDLTQAAADPRYRAPAGGTTTYSQYQQQTQAAAASTVTQNANVLPQRPDMHVERDGLTRWLVVDRPAEEVFPKVVDFWTDTGFTLAINNPQAGLIETAWAENRAKIPESWIRQLLGSIIDQAWDSGEREKFRTRVERVGNRTEIYISHQQMVEKRVGSNSDSLVEWQHGKEDPGLNAAMIARLMVYLGTDIDRARQLVAQAGGLGESGGTAAPKPTITSEVRAQGALLTIDEPFDRAWRRVGLALDSGGFSVDDRDRSAGDYYVRYMDTDTGVKREDPTIFGRLFGAKPAVAPQYRVHVSGSGMQTQVTVLDANGNRDSSPTAQRMLNVLKDKM